ncbi:MAG TPA: hypothetical protein PKI15_04385 [Candidatus Cloacimonadota bacterium]|nr:hypothetical protein [Candidatus Cloacimonadota bacterium]
MNDKNEFSDMINQMFETRSPCYKKERIKPIIDALFSAWSKNPHLRLGQLITICSNKSDVFYIEDDVILNGIHELDQSSSSMEPK